MRKDIEKPLVVANWKMNPLSLKEAKDISGKSDYKNVVVCPPYVYLEEVKKTLKKADLGAQNCFFEKKGAFTGEISPDMLKSVGCKYVILGHSERRRYFKENDEDIGKKIKKLISSKITPIICVGEEKETKGNETEYIKEQIKNVIKKNYLSKVVIAYEPLSAIGTGNSYPTYLAQQRKVFIRSILVKISKAGEKTPILYGGSVNSKNASDYIKEAGFDGLLVGGASLKAEEFKKIIETV